MKKKSKKSMKKWLLRKIKRIKYRAGWRYCGHCRKFVKFRWVKDWVYHPEEPPLFSHWECPSCGVQSDVEPTSLTEKAVVNLGFDNFDDYAEKVLSNDKKSN